MDRFTSWVYSIIHPEPMQKQAKGPDALALWMRKQAASTTIGGGDVSYETGYASDPVFDAIRDEMQDSYEFLPKSSIGRQKGMTDLESLNWLRDQYVQNAIGLANEEHAKYKVDHPVLDALGGNIVSPMPGYMPVPGQQPPDMHFTADNVGNYLDAPRNGKRNTYTAGLNKLNMSIARIKSGLDMYKSRQSELDERYPYILTQTGYRFPGTTLSDKDIRNIALTYAADIYGTEPGTGHLVDMPLRDMLQRTSGLKLLVPEDPNGTAWPVTKVIDPKYKKAMMSEWKQLSDKVGGDILAQDEYQDIPWYEDFNGLMGRLDSAYGTRGVKANFDYDIDLGKLSPEEQKRYYTLLMQIPYVRANGQLGKYARDTSNMLWSAFGEGITGYPMGADRYLYETSAFLPEEHNWNLGKLRAMQMLGIGSKVAVGAYLRGSTANAAGVPFSNLGPTARVLASTYFNPAWDTAHFGATGVKALQEQLLGNSQLANYVGDFGMNYTNTLYRTAFSPVSKMLPAPASKPGKEFMDALFFAGAPVADALKDTPESIIVGHARSKADEQGATARALTELATGLSPNAREMVSASLQEQGIEPTPDAVDGQLRLDSDAKYSIIKEKAMLDGDQRRREAAIAQLELEHASDSSEQAIQQRMSSIPYDAKAEQDYIYRNLSDHLVAQGSPVPDAYLQDPSVPAANKLGLLRVEFLSGTMGVLKNQISNYGQNSDIENLEALNAIVSSLGGEDKTISDANTAMHVRTAVNTIASGREGEPVRRSMDKVFEFMGGYLSQENLSDDDLKALLDLPPVPGMEGMDGVSVDMLPLLGGVHKSTADRFFGELRLKDKDGKALGNWLINASRLYTMASERSHVEGGPKQMLDAMPGIRDSIIGNAVDMLTSKTETVAEAGVRVIDAIASNGGLNDVVRQIMVKAAPGIDGARLAKGAINAFENDGGKLGDFILNKDLDQENSFLKYLPEEQRKAFKDTFVKEAKSIYWSYLLDNPSKLPQAAAIAAKLYGFQTLSKYLADPMVFWPCLIALVGITGITLMSLFVGDDDDDEDEHRYKGPGIDYEAVNKALRENALSL